MSKAIPTSTITNQVTTLATTAPALSTTGQPDNETLKNEMIVLAETLANTINKQDLSTALTEGENSTAFAAVLDQLKSFKADNPQVTYDYVLEQKNGTVTFVITNYYGEQGRRDSWQSIQIPQKS